jgi:hypothetical protein
MVTIVAAKISGAISETAASLVSRAARHGNVENGGVKIRRISYLAMLAYHQSAISSIWLANNESYDSASQRSVVSSAEMAKWRNEMAYQ